MLSFALCSLMKVGSEESSITQISRPPSVNTLRYRGWEVDWNKAKQNSIINLKWCYKFVLRRRFPLERKYFMMILLIREGKFVFFFIIIQLRYRVVELAKDDIWICYSYKTKSISRGTGDLFYFSMCFLDIHFPTFSFSNLLGFDWLRNSLLIIWVLVFEIFRNYCKLFIFKVLECYWYLTDSEVLKKFS